MPTSLPRFQVTETRDVAAAIDAAAILWPGESRSRLVVKLIDAGGRAVQNEVNDVTEARLMAIRSVVGTLDDIYGPGYLKELRTDWPD